MQTFELVESKSHNIQVIPLRWAFAYKFSDDGVLDKFKSRLVVRGDLQNETNFQDTRAISLATRSLRVLMSITAAFNLDAVQLDVKNAFLNAELRDEEAFTSLFQRASPANVPLMVH